MRERSVPTAQAVIVRVIEQAFDARAWHGTNLRGSLRGLSVDELTWRPEHGRHCIWEVALHCAYWKYAVRRRIVGGVKRGSFPRSPSDWPALPEESTGTTWKTDLALLERCHLEFRAVVENIGVEALVSARGDWSKVADMAYGIASHDLYHAGQIQLLKRLQRG